MTPTSLPPSSMRPTSAPRSRRSSAASSSSRIRTGRGARRTFLLDVERQLVDGHHVVEPLRQLRSSRMSATLICLPMPRAEHLAETSPRDLVELLLRGDQRRRDLDDRVAAVVGAADEPLLEQPRREEAAQQRLALLLVEASPASPCPSRARARRRSPSRAGRRRSAGRAAARAWRGTRRRCRARSRRCARAS